VAEKGYNYYIHSPDGAFKYFDSNGCNFVTLCQITEKK